MSDSWNTILCRLFNWLLLLSNLHWTQVIQWLRLHVPSAGAWVLSLVNELNPTCCNLEVHAVSKTWLVELLSHVRLFVTPWTAAHQASLSITNSWSLLKLMSIESVMPSNLLILCHPVLLLPSISPSQQQGLYQWVSSLNQVAKYWSFSFSISLSNEYSGLISFKMDWLDLLAFWGTLKNLLQHHSSKASILQCSAFFIVQLSHPYVTIGKTIALTRWSFVGKVMFLLFNMLSRLVKAFLPRSKHHLISWLQSPSAVIFSSVTQFCLTIGNPVDCSMPGFPVHHQLPELAQTHAHWVGYDIQPSHPLSSPSPPAFNLS